MVTTTTEDAAFIIDALNVKCNGQAKYIELLEKEIEDLKKEARALKLERTYLKIELKQAGKKVSKTLKTTLHPITILPEKRVYLPRTRPTPNNKIDRQHIIDTISRSFGKSIEELAGGERKREFAEPRQWLMLFLRRFTSMYLTEIGRLLGGRDHSTIDYGIWIMEQRMEKMPEFKSLHDELEQRILESAPETESLTPAHLTKQQKAA